MLRSNEKERYGDLHDFFVIGAILLAAGSGTILHGQTYPAVALPLSETCQLAAGKSDRTAALFKEISVGRGLSSVFDALGAMFAQNGNTLCAIESFQLALHFNSASWQTRHNLALALMEIGRHEDAAQNLKAALRLKPGSSVLHNALGTALQNLGELDASANEFKAALRIDPAFAYAGSNLAQVLHTQGKHTAEVYYLEQALQSGPPRDLLYSLRLALGAAYDELGGAENTERAIVTFRSLIAAFPQSAEARFNLGTLYARHTRFNAAKPEFEETLKLDSHYDAARLSLGKTLLEAGQNAAAMAPLEEYTRRKPHDFEGHLVLGRVRRGLGDFLRAADALRQAVTLNPNSYDARYNLGFVLARLEKSDDAIEHLEAAGKLNPSAPEAPYELSRIFARRNDPERAAQESQKFQEAKQARDREENLGVLGAKANDLLRQGDAQGAAEVYREILRQNPSDNPTPAPIRQRKAGS